jgi:hypothetical protein
MDTDPTRRWIRLIEGLSLLVLLSAVDCGNTHPLSNKGACVGDCACSGTTCTCQAGGTCSFVPMAPGSGDGGVAANGEAGVSGSGTAAALPNDVTFDCNSKNQCDLTCGSGCTSTCDGRSICVGTCTSNCTSSCAGTSQCTLSAGTNSQATCTGGSTCDITIDTGSTITCQGESTCTINCPQGGCTAECGGAASCTVVCGGTTACKVNCNGTKMADCAPGTTCSGLCGHASGGDHDAGARPEDAGHPRP